MVYFNFFGCVLTPLLAMLAIYARIFMAARRQLRQMEQKLVHLQEYAHREGSSSRSTLQREVHAAKSLAIIVGLFAICWLPLHIINCFTLFCPQCDRPQDWVMYLAIILSHANSVVNPFIYAYRIRDFRHTFRRIIRQHFLWHENRLATGNSNGGMAASSAAVSVIETSCTVSNGYVLDANPIPGMVSCDKFTKQMPPKTRPQTEFQDLGYSLNGTLEHSFPASSTKIFSLHTMEEVPSIRDHVEIMTVKDCSAITNGHVRCLVPIRTSNSSDLAEVSWHTLPQELFLRKIPEWSLFHSSRSYHWSELLVSVTLLTVLSRVRKDKTMWGSHSSCGNPHYTNSRNSYSSLLSNTPDGVSRFSDLMKNLFADIVEHFKAYMFPRSFIKRALFPGQSGRGIMD